LKNWKTSELIDAIYNERYGRNDPVDYNENKRKGDDLIFQPEAERKESLTY